MFWKYLVFILLLTLPGSRNVVSGAFARAADETSQDDSLIDKIIAVLQIREPDLTLDKKDNTFEDDTISKDQQSNPGTSNTDSNSSDGGGTKVSGDPPPPGGSGDAASDPSSEKQEGKEEETHSEPGNAQAYQHRKPDGDGDPAGVVNTNTLQFLFIVIGGCVAGFVGLMVAGVCYYKFRRHAKAASEVEYPAYGVTGPTKDRLPSPGDRKLAQSAQMYHYQHQKQQMIAMEKANGDMKHDASDDDSEEENMEGDYTVYECPGLAPTGEMEVRNPLFQGDEAAVTPQEGDAPPPPGSDPEHDSNAE